MKTFTLIIVILSLLSSVAFAREDSQLARVTVYWASGGRGSDRDTRHHRCATGARLRDGHCAVDPKHIPYGSRVLLPNGESLAAVDTGSAVKNRKAARRSGRTASEKGALVVDRFFETKRQAMSWANSHPAFMPIRVVRPNAPSLLRAQAFPQAPMAANRIPPQAGKGPQTASAVVASNDQNSPRLNRMGR